MKIQSQTAAQADVITVFVDFSLFADSSSNQILYPSHSPVCVVLCISI